MKHTLFLLALAGSSLQAGGLSLGVRGGAPLTDAFEVAQNRFQSIPHHYTFGPTVEVHLPAGLSINFDALYRKVEYTDNGTSSSGSSWEFPFILRKRFGPQVARPFLGAGFSVNRLSGLAIKDPLAFVKTATKGIVFDGGVDINLGVIHITPELRLTHRLEDQFKFGNLINAKASQFTALVGVTF
ncbi:MAG: hypothetical protein U0Q16_33355 [Bryobacteraceae bacterium]